MSKKKRKSFGEGINAIFGSSEEEVEETSVETKSKPKKIERNKVIETRTTLRLDVDILEDMRAVAYWERKPMKKVLSEALDAFFSEKGEKYMQDARKNYIENN